MTTSTVGMRARMVRHAAHNHYTRNRKLCKPPHHTFPECRRTPQLAVVLEDSVRLPSVDDVRRLIIEERLNDDRMIDKHRMPLPLFR